MLTLSAGAEQCREGDREEGAAGQGQAFASFLTEGLGNGSQGRERRGRKSS